MKNSDEKQAGMKHKIAHELRKLVAIFVYLAAFFVVFKLYTRLVLAEYQINYFAYGLTLLKALALAKIVLTGEALRLGERFRERPLIIPTFFKTVVFSVFALVFEVVEHLILGLVRGKDLAEISSELLNKGWPHLVAMTMVVFVAFLPFFAFRELERVLGEGKLRDLFFKPKAAAIERGALGN